MNHSKTFLFVCDNCGRKIWLSRPQQVIACKCGSRQSKDAQAYEQVFQENKLGIAYTSVQKIGGAETFLRTMINTIGPAMSGAAVLAPTIHSSNIRHGLQALDDLAAASDILLVWGFVEKLESLVDKYPQTKFYAIHHGSLGSAWANEMFAAQLKITGLGVAVNKEVASHFGVDWLPNPVLKPTFGRAPNSTSKPRILWNHRWSEEKRPDLALAIAAELGDQVHFAISAPPSFKLPSNCQNIGQTTSNVNWLSGADVFISTANQEAFGYSLAEAAYVGVPIVCSPFGIGADVGTRIITSDDPSVWASEIIGAVGADCRLQSEWINENHGQKAVEQWASFIGADIAMISKPILQPQVADKGPGTELEKILKGLRINPKIGCGCASIKKKMNNWGIDGCRVPENHAWIVGQLTENAKRYSWSDAITAASVAVLSPSLLDVQFLCKMAGVGWPEALIDKAIRQAEAESAKM